MAGIDFTKINAQTLNAGLTEVAEVLPILEAGYGMLKSIWLTANPGKTEEDYFAALQTAAEKNVEETGSRLEARGYKFVNGKWYAPGEAIPSATPPTP